MTDTAKQPDAADAAAETDDAPTGEDSKPAAPREVGGPKGPEPTRYGDWEVGGRCSDF